jgi:hypothetical protein
MKKAAGYLEGSKAREQFERTMTTLFQVKKVVNAKKIKNKAKKDKD